MDDEFSVRANERSSAYPESGGDTFDRLAALITGGRVFRTRRVVVLPINQVPSHVVIKMVQEIPPPKRNLHPPNRFCINLPDPFDPPRERPRPSLLR